MVYNYFADKELERIYAGEKEDVNKIKILDKILGGESNFYMYGSIEPIPNSIKLACLEQEYLFNLGLIELKLF